MYRPSQNRSSRTAGFTLIELIIVMTFIALISAAVIPIYQGSLTRIQKDRATRDFIAYMKYAQERAITDATEYRFYISDKDNAFWVMRLDKREGDEKEFAYPDEGASEVKYLPESVTVEKAKARRDKDRDARFIAFYGSGACDYATITLEDEEGNQIKLETKGRLGQFEVEEK